MGRLLGLVPKFVIWVNEAAAAWAAAGRFTPTTAPTARTRPSKRDFRDRDRSMGPPRPAGIVSANNALAPLPENFQIFILSAQHVNGPPWQKAAETSGTVSGQWCSLPVRRAAGAKTRPCAVK